jgi:hypothetical protein
MHVRKDGARRRASRIGRAFKGSSCLEEIITIFIEPENITPSLALGRDLYLVNRRTLLQLALLSLQLAITPTSDLEQHHELSFV